MRRIGIKILVIVAIGFISWKIFIPSYEYHYYKLEKCPNSYLTAIIYSKIGERGVMFVNGKLDKIPSSNYIIYRHLSGFDAYFNCVATCEKGVITLNYISGAFDSINVANSIGTKRVDTDNFKSLRENNKGVLVEF